MRFLSTSEAIVDEEKAAMRRDWI